MDKKQGSTASRWGWLPQYMPGVARLMDERRRADGEAWVNACWRHGVVQREPGWFYASEGPLAVGTPWPEVADLMCMAQTRTQVLVVLRPKDGVADGTH